MQILPRSIRGRVITLSLAIALPLIGVLVWGFVEEANRQHAEARDLALRVARSLASDVDESNLRAHSLLERLAQRPNIQHADARNCDSMFGIVDYFPQYPDLLLYDLQGNVVCSSKPSADEASISADTVPVIARTIRNHTVKHDEPIVVFERNRWIIVTFEPVALGGRQSGFLALLQYLDLNDETYPAGTVITISNLDRMIIVRSKEAQKYVGRTGTPTPATRAATVSREGRLESVGIDGVSRQYGFRRLRTLPWRVFVGLPSDAAMASVRSFLIHGLLIGGIMLALVSVLAFYITRTIERPLAVLASTVKRAARPGTTEQVPMEGPREIQTLATAFNDMVTTRTAAELRLEALSQKLLDVQEEERSRIAREIHDELGQLLTALNMDIGGLLAATDLSADQRGMGKRIRQALAETLSSVQRIAAELRPAILDDFGLVAAVELEMEKFEQRTGIECRLSAPAPLDPLGSDVEAAIFRIVQEAMTNVARHSNAARLEIRLEVRDGELVVDIRDDGSGIPEPAINDRASIGLVGMRERARRIGGTVDVGRAPDHGTVVSLRVPALQRRAAVSA